MTEENKPSTPDEWYEYHYEKPRPERCANDDVARWNDIKPTDKWMEMVIYIGLSKGDEIILKHGYIEVDEETEKAVKVKGQLDIDDAVYHLRSTWIPKFLLKIEENVK